MLVPGSLIAYWVSSNTLRNFNGKKVSDVMITREGMATGDNDRFLRLWFEVGYDKIYFTATDFINAFYTGKKWFPYNKGGSYRKWYGNNEYIVNWENDGKEIKTNIDIDTGRTRSHNYNGKYAFIEGLTWSAISSGIFAIRYCPKGFMFDSKGAKGFVKDNENIYELAGLLNSTVTQHYLAFLAPTIDVKVGDIIQIPYITINKYEDIDETVNLCVLDSKKDWDSFETSWDFKKHPLI